MDIRFGLDFCEADAVATNRVYTMTTAYDNGINIMHVFSYPYNKPTYSVAGNMEAIPASALLVVYVVKTTKL